jgi:hypothetical protein
VLIVDNDEAMKSASRPGSVMFEASVCRSSERSVDLQVVGVVGPFGRRADARAQIRLRRHDLVELQARQPLDDEPQAAVGQLEHLVDVRRRADAEQIVLRRLLDRGVALREHRDQLAVRDRIVDQADRALARHGERHEGIRKEDSIAKRQNRQLRWNRQRPVADRDVLGFEVLDLIAHSDLLYLATRIAEWSGDCGTECTAIRTPRSEIPIIEQGTLAGGMGSATGGAPKALGRRTLTCP